MAEHPSLGFAIVGCGFISAQHARAIQASPTAVLRITCDVVLERARALAAQYAAEATADFAAVLKREDVDVVAICTLPALHADLVVRAALAGKHVLVEKPIATSLEEADRMIDTCREAGVKLAVIHQLRFSAINLRLLELLSADTIGAPFFIDVAYRTHRAQAYFDQNERGTGRLDGGGAFITHAIHDIDLMIAVMGPARAVTARKAVLGHVMEVEDAGAAIVEFESGGLGVLTTGTCIQRHHDRTIEIHGPRGTLAHDERVLEHYITRGQPITCQMFGPEAPGALHKVQVDDLVEAIRADREPIITGETARRSLALVDAIYRSARSGRLANV